MNTIVQPDDGNIAIRYDRVFRLRILHEAFWRSGQQSSCVHAPGEDQIIHHLSALTIDM